MSEFSGRLDDVERRLNHRLDVHGSHLARLNNDPSPRRTGAIAIATSGEPVVSVVIPVHGAIDDTLQCLASIGDNLPRTPIEVIVANDASDPQEFAPIREVEGIAILDIVENQGFLRTCNDAVALARGRYVWLLNSDTEIGPDSCDALVQTFLDFPGIGAAGSKLVYGDGALQEAGGLVWNDASAWNVGRDDDAGRSEFDHARQVDYVSAASLMIDRALWNDLDGFDTVFVPAYYEDTDLCQRITMSGRRVMYQSGSVVVHHEGRSYGTDVSQQGKHHQVINRETFEHRWAAELARRRPNGVEPQTERERFVVRRVLVIDSRMLTPDQDSGSLRMQNLLLSLTAEHCRCTFLPHNMAADEPYAQALRVRGVEVVSRPRTRSVEHFLRQRGREFDAVILSRLEVAEEHLTDVRRWCPTATVVYDTVDLHFLRLARAAALSGDRVASADAERVRDDELAAVGRSDVTLVCSTVERDLLGELCPDARVGVLGNIHLPEPEHVEPTPGGRSGLLFVGGFEHPPNVDAVQWFVAEILPRVVDAEPGVMLHVVGSRLVPEIEELAGPNVTIHGFVADLAPLQSSGRMSVAPLRFGAGVKGKVTQSLAVGLPVVGTSIAVEGAPIVSGEHALIADSAEDFAEHVLQLLRDDKLWSALARAGLAMIREYFGPEAATSVLVDILDLAASGPTEQDERRGEP